MKVITNHTVYYPTPINFTYIFSFGSLVGLFFTLQLCTGIFLSMQYTSGINMAFSSVINIMTDVKMGWWLRYMHANGASIIFILMYIHIGRSLYYRSYIKNRSWLWFSGIIVFLLMMVTAFIGYVLPWGQMSFWGATVITSLVTAIPYFGESIAYWIWGGFSINNPTLIRFFSLHYLLPFLITGIIGIHLALLHEVTSTNPVQIVSPIKLVFHPYFTFKDKYAFTLGLIFFVCLIHSLPNVLGHSDNFITANSLVTPVHIVPEWYFTPFYAILRSCPNKLGGVLLMLAAILILALLPFYYIAQNTIASPFSLLHKFSFLLFIFIFFILLILGGKPATEPYVFASRIFTFFYYFYFLVVLQLIPIIEYNLLNVFFEEFDSESLFLQQYNLAWYQYLERIWTVHVEPSSWQNLCKSNWNFDLKQYFNFNKSWVPVCHYIEKRNKIIFVKIYNEYLETFRHEYFAIENILDKYVDTDIDLYTNKNIIYLSQMSVRSNTIVLMDLYKVDYHLSKKYYFSLQTVNLQNNFENNYKKNDSIDLAYWKDYCDDSELEWGEKAEFKQNYKLAWANLINDTWMVLVDTKDWTIVFSLNMYFDIKRYYERHTHKYWWWVPVCHYVEKRNKIFFFKIAPDYLSKWINKDFALEFIIHKYLSHTRVSYISKNIVYLGQISVRSNTFVSINPGDKNLRNKSYFSNLTRNDKAEKKYKEDYKKVFIKIFRK